VKIVSGTTGLSDEQSHALALNAKSFPILHATKFSIDVCILNKFEKLQPNPYLQALISK
jgi:dihydrodipicolinate reductase